MGAGFDIINNSTLKQNNGLLSFLKFLDQFNWRILRREVKCFETLFSFATTLQGGAGF